MNKSPFPRWMLQPGQDGYLTPTIEDLEKSPRPHSNGADPSTLLRRLHSRVSQDKFEDYKEPEEESTVLNLHLKERIRHFTWIWFAMTMATGGMANVMYAIPFRFHGLYTIGCIFYLLNIALFIFNAVMISLRFYFYPDTFRASLTHPTEGLFVPSAIVSFGVILIGAAEYAFPKTGHWFSAVILVMYWIYCAIAVLGSCAIYLTLWSTQTFTIAKMTPIWVFPAYPLLIVGPMAGVIAKSLSQKRALDVIISGVTLQGIGFMISCMVYSAFIYRLMTQKLPQESVRPGMFVSVGPSGFTVTGLITMAFSAERILPADFMGDGKTTAVILKILANWVGLWVWGLALWFFLISVGAHWSCVGPGKMQFAMTWYSFVFPNTALVTATLAVGKAFSSRGINILGTVIGVALVPLWFFVFIMMLRAVKSKDILWPQKGEDKEEGGWVRKQINTGSVSA